MVSATIDLRATIARALAQAQAEEAAGDTSGKLHRDRSRLWVEALGRLLREFYGAGVCVFTKHCPGNRKAFGLNELLYDVCVCDTAETIAASKSHTYITKCRWQIESEFSCSVSQALKDFNKLVLGSAENKLFIGSLECNPQQLLAVIAEPARYCTGNVFVALLPHPRGWPGSHSQNLWRWTGGNWAELSN